MTGPVTRPTGFRGRWAHETSVGSDSWEPRLRPLSAETELVRRLNAEQRMSRAVAAERLFRAVRATGPFVSQKASETQAVHH